MADEWDETRYQRDQERSEMHRAGFVQVGPTSWIAARHVERIQLEPAVGDYVEMVSGKQIKIDEECRKDFVGSLASRIRNDMDRYEQVTGREISGSVSAYTYPSS